MKITKALSESAQATIAGAAGEGSIEFNITTVTPNSGDNDQRVLQLFAESYVTIIVVVAVIIFLIFGLAIYKSYTTWASARSKRRRHSSQRWLTEDSPEIWGESFYGEPNTDQLTYCINL